MRAVIVRKYWIKSGSASAESARSGVRALLPSLLTGKAGFDFCMVKSRLRPLVTRLIHKKLECLLI